MVMVWVCLVHQLWLSPNHHPTVQIHPDQTLSRSITKAVAAMTVRNRVHRIRQDPWNHQDHQDHRVQHVTRPDHQAQLKCRISRLQHIQHLQHREKLKAAVLMYHVDLHTVDRHRPGVQKCFKTKTCVQLRTVGWNVGKKPSMLFIIFILIVDQHNGNILRIPKWTLILFFDAKGLNFYIFCIKTWRKKTTHRWPVHHNANQCFHWP